MAYQFTLDHSVYTGHTVPGSSWMRIFDHNINDYIGTYIPLTYQTRDGNAKGVWKDIVSVSYLETLTKLQSQVIDACERRYIHFQTPKCQNYNLGST